MILIVQLRFFHELTRLYESEYSKESTDFYLVKMFSIYPYFHSIKAGKENYCFFNIASGVNILAQ